MNVYRFQHTDGLFEEKQEVLIGSDIPCRYSNSNQTVAEERIPNIQNSSHLLFCSLDVDIREGDKVEVTHIQTGKKVVLNVGEGFPYTFQKQFRVKRSEYLE